MAARPEVGLPFPCEVAHHLAAQGRVEAQLQQSLAAHAVGKVGAVVAHHPEPRAFDELAQARRGRQRVLGPRVACALDFDDLVDQLFDRGRSRLSTVRDGRHRDRGAEAERIDGRAVHAKLEMQVRAGGPSGGADVPDDVARLHPVALLEGAVLRHVGIARLLAAPVVDVDHVAIAPARPGVFHRAIHRRDDRRAGGCGPVDAVVVAHLLQDRVVPGTEGRGLHTLHRHDHAAPDAAASAAAGHRGVEVEAGEFALVLALCHVAGERSGRPFDAHVENAAQPVAFRSRGVGVEHGEVVAVAGKTVEVEILGQDQDQLPDQRL